MHLRRPCTVDASQPRVAARRNSGDGLNGKNFFSVAPSGVAPAARRTPARPPHSPQPFPSHRTQLVPHLPHPLASSPFTTLDHLIAYNRQCHSWLSPFPLPEEHGGLGMNEVDLVLILEEAGRAALPEPLLETTAIGVPLLFEAGSEAQQKEWLPKVAAGEAVISVQLADAPTVVDAHVADLLLIQRGDELHAVPKDAFSVTAQPSLDGSRRVFTVDANLSADTRMAGISQYQFAGVGIGFMGERKMGERKPASPNWALVSGLRHFVDAYKLEAQASE